MNINENLWKSMKSIKIDGNLWKLIKNHVNKTGNPWTLMNLFNEKQWKAMKMWKVMKFHENKWKPMKSNEKRWKVVKIDENQWKALKIVGNPWKSTESHKNRWKSMLEDTFDAPRLSGITTPSLPPPPSPFYPSSWEFSVIVILGVGWATQPAPPSPPPPYPLKENRE